MFNFNVGCFTEQSWGDFASVAVHYLVQLIILCLFLHCFSFGARKMAGYCWCWSVSTWGAGVQRGGGIFPCCLAPGSLQPYGFVTVGGAGSVFVGFHKCMLECCLRWSFIAWIKWWHLLVCDDPCCWPPVWICSCGVSKCWINGAPDLWDLKSGDHGAITGGKTGNKDAGFLVSQDIRSLNLLDLPSALRSWEGAVSPWCYWLAAQRETGGGNKALV